MRLLLLTFILVITSGAVFAKTASDRILKTGELRCGYILSEGAMDKDPNTGAYSGIIYDVLETAAKSLNIKINWAEELGWGNAIAALESGRVDAICTNYWINPAEARVVGYTMPLYYSAVGVYVRANETRFDKGLDAINKPDIKIAAPDGEIASLIAREDFPKATIHDLPNMAHVTQQLMDVVSKKADVTFADPLNGESFLKQNPGALKNIATKKPIRLFPNAIAIPNNDPRLKYMLDAAFMQILLSGQMDKTLKKHEKYPGTLYPVAQPWVVPKQ